MTKLPGDPSKFDVIEVFFLRLACFLPDEGAVQSYVICTARLALP